MPATLIFEGAYNNRLSYTSGTKRKAVLRLSGLLPKPGALAPGPQLIEQEATLTHYFKTKDVTIVSACLLSAECRDRRGHWSLYCASADSPLTWQDLLPDKGSATVATSRTGASKLVLSESLPIRGVTRVRATYTFMEAATTKSLPVYDRPLSCDSFSVNDIAFLFPNETAQGKILWANKRVLQSASAYYKTMFDSDFMESRQILPHLARWQDEMEDDLRQIMSEASKVRDQSCVRPSKRARTDEVRGGLGDSVRVIEKGKGRPVPTDVGRESEIAYIIVTDEHSDTYRLVFSWLEGQAPCFGKLPHKPVVTSATSPDTVYAKADFLQLVGLKRLALLAYSSQLTAKNCLAHLLGEQSRRYPELRQVALDAVLSHAEAIKTSGGPLLLGQMLKDAADRDQRNYLTDIMIAFSMASSASSDKVSQSGAKPSHAGKHDSSSSGSDDSSDSDSSDSDEESSSEED